MMNSLILWISEEITSTRVAADRGVLRIWRWTSLPEGGQKFWLQWQLADTVWLPCACIAGTRSAAERPSNAPTQSYHSLSSQRSYPHLNSIFASKLHALDPLHWVICIRLIRWHGAHLQTVVIVMEILLPDPEKLPSSLWSRNLRVLPKLMSGHAIAYTGDLHFYHNILCFLQECSILFKKKDKLNSNMHNELKLNKKNPHQFNVVLIRWRTWWHQHGILK